MKVNNQPFDIYSQYYDLIYSDKNYSSEVGYVRNLFKMFGLIKGNVLEFGSGTGGHAKLLSEKDFFVHGIELSSEMINKTKLTDRFTCQQGDICSLRTGKKYDAVISLFHVMSYLITNDQLNSVFANAGHHLNIGGLFIFDFWYSPAVNFQKPAVKVKRMANKYIDVFRVAEPVIYSNDNRVDVNYTIFVRNIHSGGYEKITETHSMRHFSLPEINHFAKLNGFELIKAEEFLSGEAPSEQSWGVCVVLQKI
jgi:SAM-dependent methyltransferase